MAARKSGNGPIRSVPACGVPVDRRISRITAGEADSPNASRYTCWITAAEPATIGEALEVPENVAVK